MSIKDTYKQLRDLLAHITLDLEKSENGNKAASQRVRTGTVRLEKIAKTFRKESIATEKKTKGQKKTTKTKGATAGAAMSAKAKGAKKPSAAASKSASVKAKPKAAQAKATVKPRHLSVKRATAKLPSK